MLHSKAEILRGLDPTNPATIQALIDHHRSTFGGWKMEGDEGESKGSESDSAKPDEKGDKTSGDKSDDKPLGPNGEKALQSERDARKALENQLNQLKSGLASALGVNGGDAKSSTDDVLASVQQQLATMQRENLVLSVAGSHKITDEDDLGLLRDFKGDADGLRKLAARLKPSDKVDNERPGVKKRPAPDYSQGQGSSKAGLAGVNAGRDMFNERKKPSN